METLRLPERRREGGKAHVVDIQPPVNLEWGSLHRPSNLCTTEGYERLVLAPRFNALKQKPLSIIVRPEDLDPPPVVRGRWRWRLRVPGSGKDQDLPVLDKAATEVGVIERETG